LYLLLLLAQPGIAWLRATDAFFVGVRRAA
jgi:hypothetical protein